MLREFKPVYQDVVEPFARPIKEVTFRATGGKRIEVSKLHHSSRMEISFISDNGTQTATFDKSDLGDFIKILQNIHDQLV